jgi:hypothetical protein
LSLEVGQCRPIGEDRPPGDHRTIATMWRAVLREHARFGHPVGDVAAQYDWFMQRRRNRRTKASNRARRSTDKCDAEQLDDPEWVWVGDRRMFVVGHTPGGAPFGCFEDELEEIG